MTFPAHVADEPRHLRTQRLYGVPTPATGVTDQLPDPKRDHRAYLTALRRRMRAYMARYSYADEQVANARAQHLHAAEGDTERADVTLSADQDVSYWKSQRTQAGNAANMMAVVILAEQALRDLRDD